MRDWSQVTCTEAPLTEVVEQVEHVATVSVPPLVPVERPLTVVVVAPLTMLTRIVWVSGTWS